MGKIGGFGEAKNHGNDSDIWKNTNSSGCHLMNLLQIAGPDGPGQEERG